MHPLLAQLVGVQLVLLPLRTMLLSVQLVIRIVLPRFPLVHGVLQLVFTK